MTRARRRPDGPLGEEVASPRAWCLRCRRPNPFCLCDRIPRVDTRTRIEILQHRRESFHPHGTARLATLALDNSALHVVGEEIAPVDFGSDAALLFPSPASIDIADLAPPRRPSRLVVIDGTWRQATRMIRDNPWLTALPCVRLRPREKSRYRMRRARRDDHLSTIEAVVAALRTLEPDNDALADVLEPFEAMVNEQIAFLDQHGHVPRFRRRPPRKFPSALLCDPHQLVVCSAEGVSVDGARRLVCFDARRLDGSADLRLIARRLDDRPTDCHLAEMGLDPDAVARGMDPSEIVQRWRAFIRPDDVLLSWTRDPLRLLDAALHDRSDRVVLKDVFGRAHGRSAGTLPEVLEALGIAPARQPDRCAWWLTQTDAAARHLIDGARRAREGGFAPDHHSC